MEVYLKDSSFIPDCVTVKKGDTVAFCNEENDKISHRISCKYYDHFPSAIVSAGCSYHHRFVEAGRYEVTTAIGSKVTTTRFTTKTLLNGLYCLQCVIEVQNHEELVDSNYKMLNNQIECLKKTKFGTNRMNDTNTNFTSTISSEDVVKIVDIRALAPENNDTILGIVESHPKLFPSALAGTGDSSSTLSEESDDDEEDDFLIQRDLQKQRENSYVTKKKGAENIACRVNIEYVEDTSSIVDLCNDAECTTSYSDNERHNAPTAGIVSSTIHPLRLRSRQILYIQDFDFTTHTLQINAIPDLNLKMASLK